MVAGFARDQGKSGLPLLDERDAGEPTWASRMPRCCGDLDDAFSPLPLTPYEVGRRI